MGIAWGVTAVVLSPAMWFGVEEAVPLSDAYSRARFMFDVTRLWPGIAAYDRKSFRHRGLVLRKPVRCGRDEYRALAQQARADAIAAKGFAPDAHAVVWLERFANRLQAEADFDMTKGAALWR